MNVLTLLKGAATLIKNSFAVVQGSDPADLIDPELASDASPGPAAAAAWSKINEKV
jgi:hypothetical protein